MTASGDTIIDKYLRQYAEAEARILLENPPLISPKSYGLVIPACHESSDFVGRLLNHPAAPGLLLILVINQSPEATTDTAEANRALADFCCRQSELLWQTDHLSLRRKAGLHILLIDRHSDQRTIPATEGVGLARKVGADSAAALYATGLLTCPVIFSSDADATLPDDYFAAITAPSGHGAWTYNFRHRDDGSELAAATQLYERAIKYYRRGLAYAGSPYAFHTLGSTLAFGVASYAGARGFPRRSGGEDFYLLNKLAKMTQVQPLQGTTIELDARLSDRVPFGTGPAVSKILQQQDHNVAMNYYAPRAFTLLRTVLAAQPVLWDSVIEKNQTQTTTESLISQLHQDGSLAQQDIDAVARALSAIGIARFYAHAHKQCRTQEQFLRQFHQWFDAFVTLKFLHGLRDAGVAHLPLEQCLLQARTEFR